MAAESERPPYQNGHSGRTRDAKDPECVSDTTHYELANDSDMVDSPRPVGKSSIQAMTQVPQLTPHLSIASASPSVSSSVVSSRESSPVRKSSRAVTSTTASRVHSQSRQSSQDRPSPTRSSANGQSPSASTFPSTPSTSRATAHNNTPILSPPTSTDSPPNVLSPEKHNMQQRAGNRRTDAESTPPNTSLKRTILSPPDEHGQVDRSAPRVVSRGASGQGPSLETVQEMASNPSTPSSDTILKPSTPDDARLHTIDEDPTPRALKHNVESGSDSGGNRSSGTKDEELSGATGTTKTKKTIMPQRSTTSLSAGARGKPTDGSVQNMVVETETVNSIPQVSLGVGAGDRGERGSVSRTDQPLRSRTSEETIRMLRKERNTKKRRINPPTGPTSSKADIFEAKVASAVDEADVSDSDETFVYESNPPDPFPNRQRSRYHSRTPSATSMVSQADQRPVRVTAIRDGTHSVTGKRSMKFAKNSNNGGTYNASLDGESVDGDAVRHTNGSGTVTPRHLALGRSHRGNGGGGYQSIFDSNSPFPQQHQQQHQPKSPRHVTGSTRHLRTSPRSNPGYKTFINSKKAGDVYDFDAEGADDEGTPLVTPRAPRSRGGRRPNSTSLRQMEYMAQRQRGYFSRYGSCVIILLLLLIIAGGVTSFIIAATRILLDVQVVNIQNVLASEQELMLDLNVQAVNPNIFPLTIDDTDLNIFARSRYVGTDKFWREHGSDELEKFPLPRVKESQRRWHLSQIVRCLGNMECVDAAMSQDSPPVSESKGGGVDHGTDPIDDPEGDSQTMLLGRVFHFDSPLSFEASPWSSKPSTSKGQIRLPRPGNKTEEGGTERWERVLQHPFDLIARGVIKYQIPLSSRYFSASVNSKVKVVPSDESNGPDNKLPSNSTVKISFKRSTIPTSLNFADPATLDSASTKNRSSKRQFTA